MGERAKQLREAALGPRAVGERETGGEWAVALGGRIHGRRLHKPPADQTAEQPDEPPAQHHTGQQVPFELLHLAGQGRGPMPDQEPEEGKAGRGDAAAEGIIGKEPPQRETVLAPEYHAGITGAVDDTGGEELPGTEAAGQLLYPGPDSAIEPVLPDVGPQAAPDREPAHVAREIPYRAREDDARERQDAQVSQHPRNEDAEIAFDGGE